MKSLKNRVSESILSSTGTGRKAQVEKWCKEHKVFNGMYKINADCTVSPSSNLFDRAVLDFYGYTELPDYIQFKDCDDIAFVIGKPRELSYKYNIQIDSFRGLPARCKSLQISSEQKLLPELKIELIQKFSVQSYMGSDFKKLEIKFIDNGKPRLGNDGGQLYLRNGVEPDALKKYHITGAKMISVVNDYHLGDAFSKAMNRKGEMNKYRGRYEFPCKPEVHELVKTWWGGIDTSEVTCIEYTQNSKIVKVEGEWYRCKNW